jgi:uncharacterized membrane protein YeaQ/YmgE (transglycosylase-associated protein family)
MIGMPIVSWILLGLIAGLPGSKIVRPRGEDVLLNIIMGIFGAVTGGYFFNLFDPDRVARLDLCGVLNDDSSRPSFDCLRRHSRVDDPTELGR